MYESVWIFCNFYRYLELLVYGVKSRRQTRQRGDQWPYAAANRIEQPKERQVSEKIELN